MWLRNQASKGTTGPTAAWLGMLQGRAGQGHGLTAADAAALAGSMCTHTYAAGAQLRALMLGQGTSRSAQKQHWERGCVCPGRAPALQTLDLADNDIGAVCATALARVRRPSSLPRLVCLQLAEHGIGAAGAAALQVVLHYKWGGVLKRLHFEWGGALKRCSCWT
jgi:hypothetical protein